MFDASSRLTAIPGLVHGFSTREGGVSAGRFATLNLGERWGDEPEAVRENHARLARAAGFGVPVLRRARQVHGATVLRADALTPDSEADALLCHRGDGCVVSVLTADCVPILLADRAGSVAAAVHSGWRGTVANIAGATVRALGVDPGTLVAAIGPCIEQAAFEVGDEVAAHFDEAFVERRRWPKPHVDLLGVVTHQLEQAGVTAIDRVGGCTHAHEDRWFSYRRDGAGIGQMLSFAGFVAP